MKEKFPESKVMKLEKADGVAVYVFPQLKEMDFVDHGFSTRFGGVSDGDYRSMNLSFSNGDDDKNVLENFRNFSNALGVDMKSMVLSDQNHGADLKRVEDRDRGKGILKEKDYQGIDGLLTKLPGVPLVTQHADCVPLFFADPRNRAVAMVHSGWRGTWKKIGKKAVKEMEAAFGTNAEDLYVGIGPSIGPCCFEVKKDVLGKLQELVEWKEEDVVFQGQEKFRVNLWALNKRMLQGTGVKESRIFVTDLCTKCHPQVFFSHRVHGKHRGSLAGMIGVKEKYIISK